MYSIQMTCAFNTRRHDRYALQSLVMPPPKKLGPPVRVVDLATGEKFEQRTIDYTPKPHKESDFGFMYMPQMEKVMTDTRLTNFDTRLFVLMASRIEFNNVVMQTQVKLARGLNVRPSQVSRSLKRLIEAGYVAFVEQGRYVMDAEPAWKGSGADRDRFVEMGLDDRADQMIRALG